MQNNAAERPVTGRTVLFCLIGFFSVVAAMNAVLIRAATSTFGGVETENAYKAGLNFGRDIAAARAQDARHWRVDGTVRLDSGIAIAELTVLDASGRPITGIDVSGYLAHPTNRKLDRSIAMMEISAGRFRGSADAAPGQWDYVIEIARQSERAFQAKTRVILK
jgi:nitrogen fixation protein FixH